MFSLAMPRGQGKTAWCRASLLWGTAFGHKKFPYFIGSQHDKACQTLEFIKTFWYRATELREDFPEVAYPIFRLENRYHLAHGQIFNGQPTYIEWGSETVRYPCILLNDEEVKPYLDNDPEAVTKIGTHWMPKACGTIIRTNGIEGSIRGEAEVHPITLEQPRPDLILMDDIQKDQKAESPSQCDKLVRLIDGAVQGLAGPGKLISALMPCTVIREGDVSDVYLDRFKKPEWKGERCSMVTSWPDGLTDYDITMDTEAGKLWNQYGELRRESLRVHEDIRLATQFYADHRQVMDDGFKVSWKDRYNSEEKYGYNRELSAQQHAINLRLTAPFSFPGEFQNRPKTLLASTPLVTPAQLAERITALPTRVCPPDTHTVVSFIDIQNECLYYVTLAASQDFSGTFIDYGTWPEIPTRYFRRGQTEGWNNLSREFFLAHPELAHVKPSTIKAVNAGPNLEG